MNRLKDDDLWNYGLIPPAIQPFVMMKPIDTSIFECSLLRGLKTLSVSSSNDPPDSFHTRDLFVPHPTKLHRWKYIGRLDDRVTLLTGEKVLPLPMEGRIRESPLVREAIVFGINRSIPSLLVFRAELANYLTKEDYLDRIWPVVERANAHAESFSQIAREMIILLLAETQYPQTDKGSIIRAQVYEVFAEKIDRMYGDLEYTDQGTMKLPSETAAVDYLISTCKDQFGVSLSRSDDFFAAGIDSLRAIRLRYMIQRDLNLGGKGGVLSHNVVFETGTAARLGNHLYMLQRGIQVTPEHDLETMKVMLEKYSIFNTHIPKVMQTPEKDSIV